MNEEEFISEKDDGISSYLKGFQQGKLQAKKEEIEWLQLTFDSLREVRTKVAGLSSFQWRIKDRISQLQKEVKEDG